jgi:hypothetical protein
MKALLEEVFYVVIYNNDGKLHKQANSDLFIQRPNLIIKKKGKTKWFLIEIYYLE